MSRCSRRDRRFRMVYLWAGGAIRRVQRLQDRDAIPRHDAEAVMAHIKTVMLSACTRFPPK